MALSSSQPHREPTQHTAGFSPASQNTQAGQASGVSQAPNHNVTPVPAPQARTRADQLEDLRMLAQSTSQADINRLVRIADSDPGCLLLSDSAGCYIAHWAAAAGNDRVLSVLDTYDITLDGPDQKGRIPLFYAAKHNQLAVIQCLKIKDVNIHHIDNKRQNALNKAVKKGQIETITQFKHIGVTPVMAQVHDHPENLIQQAIRHGQMDALLALLEAFKFDDDISAISLLRGTIDYDQPEVIHALVNHFNLLVDTPNESGETAMHLAVRSGKCKAIMALRELGCAVNQPTSSKHQLPPLHQAVTEKQIDAMEALIALLPGRVSADINQCSPEESGGQTPLHIAVQMGNCEAIKWLKDHGAQDDIKNNLGHMPIQTAVFYNQPQALRELLPSPAYVLGVVNHQDDQGRTLTHLAATRNAQDVIHALSTHGANIQISDHQGDTPLHLAAQTNQAGAIDTLRQLGADITLKNDSGYCPLLTATFANSLEAITALLVQLPNQSNPPDVNAVTGDGRTALHIAAEVGYPDAVTTLRTFGADAQWLDSKGDTPVHVAAQRDNCDTLRALLTTENGLPLVAKDIRNHEGLTPLLCATQNNCVGAVHVLRDMGADLKVADAKGNTALHLAAEDNKSRITSALIGAGNHIDLNQRNSQGQTPLHVAAAHGATDVILALRSAGADLDIQDNAGDTPLMVAARANSREAIIALCRTSEGVPGVSVLQKGAEGNSALHIAAAAGHELAILTLRDCGIDLLLENDVGDTALHLAARQNNCGSIRRLLESHNLQDGIRPDVRGQGNMTALHVAAQHGSKEAVALLRQKHASVDVLDSEGYTPLQLTVKHNKPETTQQFLTVYQDIRQPNVNLHHSSNGRTALHMAVEYGQEVILGLLLSFSGTVKNARDSAGETAFMLAVANNQLSCLDILLQAEGIDLNITDQQGHTQLHLAVKNDYQTVFDKLILTPGVDLDAKDNDGDTPLHIAVQCDRSKMLEQLLKRGASRIETNNDGNLPMHLLCSRVRSERNNPTSIEMAQSLVETIPDDGFPDLEAVLSEMTILLDWRNGDVDKIPENPTSAEVVKIMKDTLYDARNHAGKTPFDLVFNDHIDYSGKCVIS